MRDPGAVTSQPDSPSYHRDRAWAPTPDVSKSRSPFTPRFATGSSLTAGTYGKVVDGFEVTESLPIPRRTGVLAAIENITSGALSVQLAEMHPANRQYVPLGYETTMAQYMGR